jgi:hypothetical protein
MSARCLLIPCTTKLKLFPIEMNPVDLRRALVEILDQGIDLLTGIDSMHYATKAPSAFNASIGSHFRHCLDHFETLLAGLDAENAGLVDYDARRRDPLVESDCTVALARAEQIRIACDRLSPAVFEREVRVRCMVSCSDAASPTVGSTFGREAMYAVVHAIHHFALINIMCDILNVETPKNFGIAPSTIAHEARQATLAAAAAATC